MYYKESKKALQAAFGPGKKPKMSMKKPKFNSKLKAAAKSGKLDNNPKFKAAVQKAKMSIKKPKLSMKKKK